MKHLYFILILCLGVFNSSKAQDSFSESTSFEEPNKVLQPAYQSSKYQLFQTNLLDKEARKKRRNLENKIDKQHGGIGIAVYSPILGKNFETGLWTEANLLTDVLEFKLGFGRTVATGFGKKYTKAHGETAINDSLYGMNLYVGGNIPLKFADFGTQQSWIKVLRGHPIISAGAGMMSFTSKSRYTKFGTAYLWYAGVSPGYRFRFPLGSLDVNFNMQLSLKSGDNKDYFGWFQYYPSFTLRLDALKLYYDPQSVTIHGTQTSTENYQSTSWVSGGYRYTYTTYDVVTRPISVGIQDIGAHIGVGPKLSYMSPKRERYIPTSILGGVCVEGRAAFLDFGFSLEGGKVGHGGQLAKGRIFSKKDNPNNYKRKLDKSVTTGLGEVKTLNFYSQIGIDLTSIIAGLAGISISKGSATSFFTFTGGINVGGHYTWGQEFLNPADAANYDQAVAQNTAGVKEKFLDPRKVGIGYLGGFYVNVSIGALSFKINNLRYYGAPFASTTMYSIAYRFPVWTKNRR